MVENSSVESNKKEDLGRLEVTTHSTDSLREEKPAQGTTETKYLRADTTLRVLRGPS